MIDMNLNGGARLHSGDTGVDERVIVIPITVPGVLYGQDVTVSGLDLYWIGDTGFEAITDILLRRQVGPCLTAACYQDLLHDSTSHGCEDSAQPNGCTLSYDHWDLANETLSASSGVLYLTIELSFSSGTAYIDLAGVRLTLTHQ